MARPWEPGPQAPPRPSPELHVWRAELDGGGWPAAARLPEEERARAGRLVRPADRERWVAARWALRLVLARYAGGDPAELELTAGPHGKPALGGSARPGDERRPHFNLSHSHGLALIALSADTEVGVDVEWMNPRRGVLELAPHALGDDAAAQLRALPADRRSEEFHRAWTRREAAVKCTGAGLGGGAPGGKPAVAGLDPGVRGYAAAVAVAAAAVPPVATWTLSSPRA